MKKITYFLIALMLMAVMGLQLTEPINAVKPKLIDHSDYTRTFYDTVDENSTATIIIRYKTSVKTYRYSKNKIVIKVVLREKYISPEKKEEIIEYQRITLRKVSPKKLKIIKQKWEFFGNTDYSKTTHYKKYSSTVNTYYNKKIKHHKKYLFAF